eukprot:TRINITY_DN608_c0_g2_i1.p1 TRINITY_DN608_c0_g2~~TRINITY_DN608_c0_g2_i1.p1  ORF type:complete len:168 (-),score=43.83 TRINITY_DN608_c0_g2_i1:14-517(-)
MCSCSSFTLPLHSINTHPSSLPSSPSTMISINNKIKVLLLVALLSFTFAQDGLNIDIDHDSQNGGLDISGNVGSHDFDTSIDIDVSHDSNGIDISGNAGSNDFNVGASGSADVDVDADVNVDDDNNDNNNINGEGSLDINVDADAGAASALVASIAVAVSVAFFTLL